MVLTSWLLLHCFQEREYEGDGGVMSHDLRHKKCRIKVFLMFCYVNERNGSLSCFTDVEPGLGNFSQYSGVQQQPNIWSVFYERWRIKWPRPRTKSSNRILCSFLGTPIHVGIILTILIGHQYDSKKLVLVSLFKKTFFHLYWIKR